MKLEVGKRYIQRNGKVSPPVEHNSNCCTYPFKTGARAFSYTPDGRLLQGGGTSEFDLVSEFEGPATPPAPPQLEEVYEQLADVLSRYPDAEVRRINIELRLPGRAQQIEIREKISL